MNDALKTKTITIDNQDSRDFGKKFQITEMPLLQADEWATSLGLGMLQGGVKADAVDLNAIGLDSVGGIFEIAKLGLGALGNVDEAKAKELIRELTESCVKIIPDSGIARDVVWEADIKEVATLWLLRKEALGIHIDFFKLGNR